MSTEDLDAFFAPRSVAVIGATDKPNSVGQAVLHNLLAGSFTGKIYPVNPKRTCVQGVPAFPSVSDIPETVDLAVIATPAETVPHIIGECVQAGIKASIILSAGFHEAGLAGLALEEQVRQAACGKIRLIGPNCLGVMSPRSGLNATFAANMAAPGSVALISQSGALCTAILDWSLREKVGFSAFLSIGSMLDVGWADLIDYLGDDPHTKSIVLYMESIGDARAFLSAAREVALTKPIIVLKAGRSEAAGRAAASHTGALAGSDEVLDAAFARCGVLRVNTIAELFYMAEALSKQPRPRGPRLTILTNAGGPGVLAADALLADGGKLTELSEETIAALNAVLPASWSHGNPIDILGDAPPERFAEAVRIAASDPNSDALLAILTPQAMTDPTCTALMIANLAKSIDKPLLASWMGGEGVAEGADLLRRAGIPCLPYPDTAARVAHTMWRYTESLRGLYETPRQLTDSDQPDRLQAANIIHHARISGRTLLTEYESKQLLLAYGIPTVETRIATNIGEAVDLANGIGYPVVLKIHSETITHKTDVGGVQLDLKSEGDVRRAYHDIEQAVARQPAGEDFGGVTVQPMVPREGYELIIGSRIDPQFGPVLLFGSGGQLVEILRDYALALPPLNPTLACRLMERTRIFKALQGVRGRKPVPLDAVESVLIRFSQLVTEQRAIAEIEINPLLATPCGVIALDARVVLYAGNTLPEDLPKPAIRPYPNQYASAWVSPQGEHVAIRPIRPEDEPLLVRFHESLSEESIYLRYFSLMGLSQRIAHDRLTRMCFIDYDRQMALVVDRREWAGPHEILGVGRLIKIRGTKTAEFSLIVSDSCQKHGFGMELLRRLLQFARDEHLEQVVADILTENHAMLRICEDLGFQLSRDGEAGVVKVSLDLLQAPVSTVAFHLQGSWKKSALCPVNEADRDRRPYFLAGDVVPAGTYLELNTHREISLETEDALPATLDGHVAVYVPHLQTWGEMQKSAI